MAKCGGGKMPTAKAPKQPKAPKPAPFPAAKAPKQPKGKVPKGNPFGK